ncbi:hypothetical protein STENM223S_07735 [Streptomyces tendae]
MAVGSPPAATRAPASTAVRASGQLSALPARDQHGGTALPGGGKARAVASTVTRRRTRRPPPGYGHLLRTRGAWTFLLPGFAARQPFAMLTLSIVLLVQHTTGSYGAAGAVAAVTGVSMALFAPYTGRLADRHGQRAVLVPGVLLHAAAGLARRPGGRPRCSPPPPAPPAGGRRRPAGRLSRGRRASPPRDESLWPPPPPWTVVRVTGHRGRAHPGRRSATFADEGHAPVARRRGTRATAPRTARAARVLGNVTLRGICSAVAAASPDERDCLCASALGGMDPGFVLP